MAYGRKSLQVHADRGFSAGFSTQAKVQACQITVTRGPFGYGYGYAWNRLRYVRMGQTG